MSVRNDKEILNAILLDNKMPAEYRQCFQCANFSLSLDSNYYGAVNE